MGTGNLRGFKSGPDSEVIAVCDVDTAHRERARQIAGLDKKSSYNDFRQLLAQEDVDAVVVSTPDHWHVPISIAAAKAGKDIYCEKPLTLSISGGRSLANVVKRYGRILQTGSQQRSDDRFRFACELVRNGRIGKLKTINVEIPGNNRENPLTWPIMPVPKGFDYDMWLGPAQFQPYTETRCFYTFRFISDYSGGQMTNWGAHYLDIAQWAMDTDDSGPVEIKGTGEFPKSGLFNTALKYDLEYTYKNGVKLTCKTGRTGIWFEGTEGWIYVDRNKMETGPKSIRSAEIRPDKIHVYRSKNHKQNFLDCIKSRKKPIADAETGHRSSTVCHLGNIALLLNRKLQWDPEKECFINDPEANKLMSPYKRSPWDF